MKKILLLVIPMLLVALYAYVNYGTVIEKDIIEPSLETESASVPDELKDAPIYVNERFGYSVHIPENMEVEEVNQHSIHINNKQKELGIGPVNFVYISVIPPEEYENDGEIYNYRPTSYEAFMSVEQIEDTVDLSQGEMTAWFTYQLVEKRDIGGVEANVFENNKPWEFPGGSTETRYIFEKEGTRYVVGYYTGGDSIGNSKLDPRTAYSIVQSLNIK